jgi:hypothetical protein
MRKKNNIVRYSAKELARLKSETDWGKVDATSREEIERQANEGGGSLPEGWENTVVIGVQSLGSRSTSAWMPTCYAGSRRKALAIKQGSTPC